MQNATTTTSTDRSQAARSQATFGLCFVFGVVIGCSLFFALFSMFPVLAIVLAVVATPAFIRVGNIEAQYRIYRRTFGWQERVTYFISSLGMMINSTLLAATAFLTTCLICSLLGYFFACMFDTSLSSPQEFAFIGATGGAIWGITSALLTIGWYWSRHWLPDIGFRTKDE